MIKHVTVKTIKDPELPGFSRHMAKWMSWDCVNRTKKVLVGPVFRPNVLEEKQSAIKEFARLLNEQLLKCIPCE